jgi:DNA-binding NtrC family response regulator
MSLDAELDAVIRKMRAERISYQEALVAFRRSYLLAALRFNMNNQCATAKELGIHRNTLARDLEVCGIDAQSLKRSNIPRGQQQTEKPLAI